MFINILFYAFNHLLEVDFIALGLLPKTITICSMYRVYISVVGGYGQDNRTDKCEIIGESADGTNGSDSIACICIKKVLLPAM